MIYDKHVIMVIMVIYTASGICTCCSFGLGISLSPHTNKLRHLVFCSVATPTLLLACLASPLLQWHDILLCALRKKQLTSLFHC